MAENIKKTFVVDASFVIAFLMPDESRLEIDSVFNQFKSSLINLTASPILPFEVTNGLKSALLKKRVTKDYCLSRMEEFFNYQIETQEVNFKEVFLLAEKYNLTTYDASYLWLNKKFDAPLLTLDKRLIKLASREN